MIYEPRKKRSKKKTFFIYASMKEGKGQARKGAGRMPWHLEPKKDVISCEKPGGAANEQ